MVKHAIMAMPYGISEHGCIDYIKDLFGNRKISREVFGKELDKIILNTDQVDVLSRFLGRQIFKEREFLGVCEEFTKELREFGFGVV